MRVEANGINRGDRSSGIELLKIIAIVFIVLSHAMPDAFTDENNLVMCLNNATDNWQFFVLPLLMNLGQIGNLIFIISSAWFLLDSTKVKSNKIVEMLVNCWVISVLFLGIGMLSGYDFSIVYIIRNIAPTIFACNWFVTYYILLYLIHPLLNIIIYNVTKKKLLEINIGFVVLFCFVSFLLRDYAGYFNNIIGFIIIYFFVAYVKLHLKNISIDIRKQSVILTISVLGWLLMALGTNALGLYVDAFSDQMLRWNIFINPFFILISISLFNIFRSFKLQNKTINYVASLSLLIYIIHCNRVIRDYVRYDVFEYVYEEYTFANILVWVLLYALISFLGAFAIAIVYKSLVERYVVGKGQKLYGFCKKYIERVFVKIEELE